MKKIIYTRSNDGGISIVIPADKESVEKILGPITEEQYESHVRDRSIPTDAIKARSIEDIDIPQSREFRNAWCDVTPESRIDIDLVKAKDIKLAELRIKRDQAMLETDKKYVEALSRGNNDTLEAIKIKKQELRDATEPLKALSVSGYNDEAVLQQIRDLSHFNN